MPPDPDGSHSSGVTLSAVVIAENEEAVLERCLNSLSFCDEIIVVDGGSSDRTIGIARALGARVIEHDSSLKGIHFNKNLGASEARGAWILSIDADEEVTPDLAAEIRRVVSSPDARDAYRVSRRTYFLGRWIRTCGWWPGHVVRLWRRGATEWPMEVHRLPAEPASCGTMEHPLEHHSYETVGDWVRKVDHFSRCEAEESRARGEEITLSRLAYELTAKPVLVLFRKIVLQSAWRDGAAGLVVAGSAAFASWLKAVRLWEIRALGIRHDLGGRRGRA